MTQGAEELDRNQTRLHWSNVAVTFCFSLLQLFVLLSTCLFSRVKKCKMQGVVKIILSKNQINQFWGSQPSDMLFLQQHTLDRTLPVLIFLW